MATGNHGTGSVTAGELWRKIYPPVENPKLRILSHGGGVQTSTLLFMAARGEIDPIDAAIMADPMREPRSVYEYLAYASEQTNTPVILASGGDIFDHIRRSKGRPDGKLLVTLPYYLADGGQMMRTCTKTLKIDVVTQEIRKLLGLKKRQRVAPGTVVEVMIGISSDEWLRAGGFPATKWQQVRYPLLEKDMSFASCMRWLEERQYRKPPRSRCIMCPYRSNESWRALEPDEFEFACEVDDLIRADGKPPRGYKSLPYLHRDRIRLREVDLTRADLFDEEDCMGGCAT
ncbi:hypothetical protein M2336_001688 [Sphingobium sp. B1D7B]|uniref:hypothetical protein n=1 Tax=Sphingobium sp. B1D7B TaxID=2940578 RepID=UPI00222488EF|nr:hypothetical protein [Sphingobium sp. B1D7B]MCW2405059.1 hypothetical protein [Sphingobium sp. B1D7B]